MSGGSPKKPLYAFKAQEWPNPATNSARVQEVFCHFYCRLIEAKALRKPRQTTLRAQTSNALENGIRRMAVSIG
jgi:hypothetical protein